ncbi:MAG: hypothetical protein LBG21_00070 [Campylobacteraceae bacterium]|jgi:hypothetical protein|nr:hypothetical protein [Campylobacteraceae bacterium]
MRTKEGSISHSLKNRYISLTVWANVRGLSKQDKNILRKLSNGTMKGYYGRAREIKDMLIEDGLIT